jgi:putative Ca2+/H+ antiporter (TMEM165/GDT1 family)
MVITAVSVIIGATLGKYIKPEIIKYCGASIFIILGILMLFGKL